MLKTDGSIQTLYRLGEQLERDKQQSITALKRRDHAIGEDCKLEDPAQRIQFWLAAVHATEPGTARTGWLSEATAAALARLLVLVLGFSGMTTFLLASGRGLVNVFIFLLLFVLIQLALCLVAAVVMFKSVRGDAPSVMPLNPARWIVARAIPDARYLRETGSVIRLVLLRYGQELGAIFTAAATVAFLVVLAFSDFSFVWGSTFALSDELVNRFTDLVSLPWSGWLPAATVSPELIASTRYHPALTHIDPQRIAAMRGWWSFLFMCLLCYALLPRLLLWLLSRYFYRRQLRASILGYPGTQMVLARMRSPVVSTQASGAGNDQPLGERPYSGLSDAAVELNPDMLLLNWSNAMVATGEGSAELAAVPEANRFVGGVGSLAEDRELVRQLNASGRPALLAVVKAWEPPMAELADLLGQLDQLQSCTLCLVTLPGRELAPAKIQDWQAFARQLPFAAVDVRVLATTTEQDNSL